MLKKKLFAFTLIVALLAVAGCIEENPALLNPPQETTSMIFRFINLIKDEPALRLALNSTTQSGLTPYASCSDTLHPPADSATATIMLDGNVIYQKKNKVRFIRNTNYSLIALPSAPGDSVQRTVDTIISIGTISSFTDRYNTAYVKVLNAIPDTTYRFSVILGCPNGKPIVQNLNYRSVGTPIELPAGDNAISVLTETRGNAPDIDLYMLQLKAGGQYTIIIYGARNNKPDLFLLDEFGGVNALSIVTPVSDNEKYAKVRTINFSASQVTVKKLPDESVAQDVLSNYITSYSDITACNSQSSDTFTSIVGSDEISNAYATLEVLKNFTIAVFDSAGSPAKLTIVAPPIRLSEPLDGRAVIRVVNSSSYYDGFTMSLGARDDSKDSTGYSSGLLISPEIKYGEISQSVILLSGLSPISLFTSHDPSSLVYNTLADLKPDRNYLIFILDDNTRPGRIKLFLVDDSEIDKSPDLLNEGAFTQVVHLIPDAETINIIIPPVLTQAKLYLSGSLATVMQTGNVNITINGTQKSIDVDAAKRNLFIATGYTQNSDLLMFQYTPLIIEPVNYKRRFINACKELPAVHIALNCDTCFIAKDIAYGTASGVGVISLDRKSSFMFINPADGKVLKRIDDISLPFGKNFTFILGGNSTEGYTIVQQQEF